MKLVLYSSIASIIFILSCNVNNKTYLLKIDNEKYGNINYLYTNYFDNILYYIAFTDKLYELQFFPSESKVWSIRNEYKKIDTNMYITKSDFKEDWESMFNTSKILKATYSNTEDYKNDRIDYLIINNKGQFIITTKNIIKYKKEKPLIYNPIKYKVLKDNRIEILP